MKKILNSMAIRTLVLLFAASVTFVQAFAQERPAFRQEELDQMLAPVALYPDSLLSQILMASTYPLEVVQAARWSRSQPHLRGQDAVQAVEPMNWDPSVKSLVAFPQILHRMDEQLDWTQRLGEAFLAQQADVMDTVQGLRRRAEAAGNLRSSEQMRVARQGEVIVIHQPAPEIVYIPYYNPVVVYGPWWWPGYPPVYWGPPAGYYVGPGYWPGLFWGSGIVIGTGFFFGHFSWPHRHVIVVHHYPAKVIAHRPGTVVHRAPVAPDHKPVRWQHDPHHRKGVPYRHAVLPRPFGQPPVARSAHPQTRNAAPQPRALPAAPNPRPERFTPQGGDRWAERNGRAEVQRLQSRAPEPRTAIVAPHVGPVPRPVAPPPVARAEPRSNPPAANARPATRQQFEPGHRAEPRNPMREHFVAPRAAASGPNHAPRVNSDFLSGSARAHGGNVRERSASRGRNRGS